MNTTIQVQAGRSSLPSLAVLFGLALLSFSIFAQAPNPPVITALDGQELDPPEQDGRYSLDDAIRGLPFTIDIPAPPQITAEQVVTPSTLRNYINTPGMRLILEPGTYGGITVGGTDKEIVLTTGVNITGMLEITGQRIIVRANPVRTGLLSQNLMINGAADVLVDGIFGSSNANVLNEIRMAVSGSPVNRVAIINSHLRQFQYPLYSGGDINHLIVGNNFMEAHGGTQAVVRLQSTQRLAFVDNLVRSSNSSGGFRLHTTSNHWQTGNPGQKADFLYVGRNRFEGTHTSNITNFLSASADGNATTNGMGSVWWENNHVYHNSLWWISTGPGHLAGWPEVLTMRNNSAYISSGGWPTAGQHPWNATLQNNTVHAYTVPPAWEHQ